MRLNTSSWRLAAGLTSSGSGVVSVPGGEDRRPRSQGQHARAGGHHKVGFEGGQMPLQRRLPKARFPLDDRQYTAEVRLRDLAKVTAEVIDLAALKVANLVPVLPGKTKVILSGTVDKPLTLRGLALTQVPGPAAGGWRNDPQ